MQPRDLRRDSLGTDRRFSVGLPTRLYWSNLQEFRYAHESSFIRKVLGIIAFYAYLWGRGVKEAEFACMTALLLATHVDSRTIGVDSIAEPQWWPLVAIGMVQAIRTILLKSSLRFVITGGSLIGALSVLLHGSWFTVHYGAIPLHLALA